MRSLSRKLARFPPGQSGSGAAGAERAQRQGLFGAYAPDGFTLASGSNGGVQVWPTLEKLVKLACSRVTRGGLTEEQWVLYVGDITPWREEGQCELERGVPVWWDNRVSDGQQLVCGVMYVSKCAQVEPDSL